MRRAVPGRQWPVAGLGLLLVLLAAWLVACAPSATNGGAPTTQTFATQSFAAAFDDAGVLWVEGGQAFIARWPGFQTERVAVNAPVQAVAWSGRRPWVAAGSAVVTASGEPRTLTAGRVVALSATRIYREDGSAIDYSGAPATGLIGAPSAVITGGNGQDYALQGRTLYRIGVAEPLDPDARANLIATPGGAATSNAPGVVTDQGLYQLTGTQLQRLDGLNVVRASVAHGPGLVGQVRGRIVTVARGGALRFFNADLGEVGP